MVNWGGWAGIVPPPPPVVAAQQESVAEGEGSGDGDDLSHIQVPKSWVTTRPARRDRSKESIDRDMVERILKDDNGSELSWLEELLVDGVRVQNNSSRYVKSEPFLIRIRKQRRESKNKPV